MVKRISSLEDYSNSLAEETLVEMAESFFGARKSVEEESEHFMDSAGKVKEFGEEALDRASLLHALLLDPSRVTAFYELLGVKPGQLLEWVDPEHAKLYVKIPFAFTNKGRYAKLLANVYEIVAGLFDEYLNGRYYSPLRHGGRKRLSLHYNLLKDWAGHINRRIRDVNEGMAPSCVLGFAKGLDCSMVEAERITGATLPGYACALDHDLQMPSVNCQALGLKEIPALPPLDQVKDKLLSFAKDVYKTEGSRVQGLLDRLAPTKRRR